MTISPLATERAGASGQAAWDFPREEYEKRVAHVRQRMCELDLRALIIHQPENIRYLSGLSGVGYFSYHALVIPETGGPRFILRDFEVPTADARSWVTERSLYSDDTAPSTTTPVEAVAQAISDLGIAHGPIGLDYHSWFLTVERLEALRRALPGHKLVAEPRIVDVLRLVKSPLEIAYHRTAARFSEAAMRSGISAIRAGANERELAAAIYSGQVLSGSESTIIGGVVQVGRRTSQAGAKWQPHGTWTDRRIERGDAVYYELNGCAHGYVSRLMRTTVVGSASDEQLRTAETIMRAQSDAIARMHPGASAGDIDSAGRTPILKAKLLERYTNRTGYSLGLIVRPSAGEFIREFTPSARWTLEAGMVFHMLSMARGIGFSETVLVTDQGPELLTQFPRRLGER